MTPLAFLVLLTFFGTTLGDYIPGTPGEPWTHEEVAIVKSKLYDVIVRGGGQRAMSKLHDVWPDEWPQEYSKVREPDAPKFLRLAFHDCLKYQDGTGGCDGCLNMKNIGHKYGVWQNGKFNPDAQWLDHDDLYENLDTSDNNGLELTAKVLEGIYIDPKYPSGTPRLEQSLFKLGKSRADLWSLAAITAVEFGVENNNLACQGPEEYLNGDLLQPPLNQCNHAYAANSSTCQVNMPRKIQFQTGRIDCIPDPNLNETYFATKPEHHPSVQGNGQDTVDFFEKVFDFNGEEIVAIMGAHTMGKMHAEISLFRYTWTTAGRELFNNHYYKNIVGGKGNEMIAFDDESDQTCTPVTDATNHPFSHTRWLNSARGQTKNGGPTFWIHENYRCPNCGSADRRKKDKQWKNEDWVKCCDNKPEGHFCSPDSAQGGMDQDDDVHKGCEKWAYIYGIDEMALNAEMGLYREFNVTADGIPYGCHGMEEFKSEHWLDVNHLGNRFRKTFAWSVKPTRPDLPIDNGPVLDEWIKDEPECPLNKMKVGGSRPLNKNFELFARDQDKWVEVFIPTFEKMMANGYKSGELIDGPTEGITCVRKSPNSGRPVCSVENGFN